MKTKEQILAWLDKQPWKDEFYKDIFLYGNPKKVYNVNFLISAFHWGKTEQGETIWSKRNKEYQKWYNSTDKPMSLEEYCKQNCVKETDWFITDNCQILPMVRKRVRNPYTDINIMSKDLCEAFLAYMKLIQLRNAWVKDCDDANMNYRIIASNCKIYIMYCCVSKMGLSFPTQEMADEFADVFKDLLETAKPLL